MTAPTLVVMAAGIGSRYGGLKQVDPVGPSGEIIIDYSLHDAHRAGFRKVVFVIKREIEEVFRERIGQKAEALMDTRYAFQELTDLPEGFGIPEGRVKPWGTGHAVLAARAHLDGPFAVINGDDFYGRHAFQVLGDFLRETQEGRYAMVGYALENTLTEHGHVSRGVCTADEDGRLTSITERTRIQSFGEAVRYTEDGVIWEDLPRQAPVSMNLWGFSLDFLKALEARFPDFLTRMADPLKAEYFLPGVVDALVQEGRATVQVLPTASKWFGITYPEDKPRVQAAIAALVAAGDYPSPLR